MELRNLAQQISEFLLSEELLYLIKKTKTSLPAFYYHFLADKSEYVKPAKFHYVISDILLKEKENFAIEAFRESGKTELVIKAYPIYKLFFPSKEKYIVLILHNQRKASAKLKDIARIHQSSKILSFDVDKVVEESEQAYEIQLANKQRIRIEAYGKGSSVRGLNWAGKRPNIVILDDVQDLEDAQSPTVLEKDWEWFLSEIKFLGKTSRVFMIGNNLGEKCLIERVFENHKELGFKVLRIPALDEKGNPTWPEKFSYSFLEKEKEAFRKAGKLDIWYRERLCQAIASENQVFRKEWFNFYSPNEVNRIKEISNVYIACDLAISEKDSADYTAIVVVAVDKDSNWYVLDCVYGRFQPAETIDILFGLVVRYQPIEVGVESVAFQALFLHNIEEEMRKRNIFFSLSPLKSSKAKELRIKSLQPRFKAGKIFFPDIADWLPEMEAELLMFPRAKHDDLIDALAYISQIAKPPAQEFPEKYKTTEIPEFSVW